MLTAANYFHENSNLRSLAGFFLTGISGNRLISEVYRSLPNLIKD